MTAIASALEYAYKGEIIKILVHLTFKEKHCHKYFVCCRLRLSQLVHTLYINVYIMISKGPARP